jgi:hypothetical protein
MEEATIQQIRKMCDRLANYHWSPKHPTEYVLPAEGGKTKGIGLIAPKNYGAFNLAWADVGGKCETVAEQTSIIGRFTYYQAHTHHVLNDVPIGDWLCFLRPRGFYRLVETDNKCLPPAVRTVLLAVAEAGVNLEERSV